MERRVRKFLILTSLLFLALHNKDSLGSSAKLETSANIASRFVASINSRNVESLIALSSSPFLFRTQKWEPTKDGSGFVLGRPEDQIRKGSRQRRELFDRLIQSVRIKSVKPAEQPPSKAVLLDDYLAGTDPTWSKLTPYVFTRGFGDVEHIALIGVDKKSGKVRALYLN